MLLKLRKWITWAIAPGGYTSLMVGSYISGDGNRAVRIQLDGGWLKGATATLSPEGARACARQLNEWADWSEKSRHVMQWQAIIKTTTKMAEASPEDAPAQ